MKMYMLILLLSFTALTAFGDTFYKHYKIYSNIPTNIVLWSEGPNASLIKNFQYDSEGFLPAGLHYQVDEEECGDSGIKYTGKIYGAALDTEPPGDDTFHAWTTSEDPYGNPVEQHYYSHIQVDDHADYHAEQKFLGTLPTLTAWSDDSGYGWTNGHLFAEETWNNIQIPKDIDFFTASGNNDNTCSAGVYCIETQVVATDIQPLHIQAYKNNNGTLMLYDELDTWNIYDIDGNMEGPKQRLYFSKTDDDDFLVKIQTSSLTPWKGNYKIRVFTVKPVFLVHGINAGPTEPGKNETTFGEMRDCLGFLEEVYPCQCYDYPWDSNKDFNGKGFLEYISDSDDSGFFKFIYDTYDSRYNKLNKANIICHSMGGFIVRHQLAYKNFANMIDQVIFLDSPQYGSELANFVLHNYFEYGIINPTIKIFMNTWGTAKSNFRHLSRGGETIWNMHHNIPLNIPPENVVCTVGTKGGMYETFGYYLTKKYNFVGDEYYAGLIRGDGIVPATSQNMQSLDKKIQVEYLDKHHMECQKLYSSGLKDKDDCKKLYELIKERMNKS
jgi:hypothetical protein